jgi:hypothetical protein
LSASNEKKPTVLIMLDALVEISGKKIVDGNY